MMNCFGRTEIDFPVGTIAITSDNPKSQLDMNRKIHSESVEGRYTVHC